ncbi:MAG: 6-phosphofructokinase [Rhizobacter sp.]|nr:6-phosphofructokinase [Rhizobacter sp.]
MRIGLLTGGGDAPGLNAVIRAVTKSLIRQGGAEVLGVEDGYLGLIERRLRALGWQEVSGIAALGGTLLGTSNRVSPLSYQGRDWRDEIVAYARELRLDGLVAIGGDGTMAIADALDRHGLRTVGVPKTIDNDIAHVERSLGFDTAVATVTEALDRVQTTGQSHGRVMLVETMGRNAGWLALEAGLAASADIILLPEIDYQLEAIAAVCRERAARQRFTVICVAEGAKPRGGQPTVQALEASRPEPVRLGGVAEVLVTQLQPLLQSEVRATVLGHVQRGGAPTAGDRVLGSLIGDAAARLVNDAAWGQMVSFEHGRLGQVPLMAVAGRTRTVPADHPLLQTARRIGVSFGDS